MSRHLAFVFAIVAVLCITACGDDKSSSPSSTSTLTLTPTVVAPTPRLVQQGSFTLKAPEEESASFGLVPITDASAGLWEATVDWTMATNTMWMWVANGACTVEQFARPDCPNEATCPCQFTIRSETATPKPRVLTIPNAPGGTRTLIVMNMGPREESGSYRVMLTPSSLAASSTSATPATTSAVSTRVKSIGRR